MDAGDLTPQDVFTVAVAIEGIEALVVGGQALNIWAERFSERAPELRAYGPFTSRDIDYFGYAEAAQQLAAKLGGEAKIPEPDDHTPNTAVVLATVNGKTLLIDFIGHVLGVRTKHLAGNSIEIDVPCVFDAREAHVLVNLMHPVHCLQSRVANVLHPAMRREDDTSRRQLAAAVPIVREYIVERLEVGDLKEATESTRDFFGWLKTDEFARQMHVETETDPLPALEAIARAPGWDERYRTLILNKMVERIISDRQRRTRHADAARRR